MSLLFVTGLPAPASAAPPANDNFAAAELLTGTRAAVTGTSDGATKEAGEPNHDGYSGGRSTWYRWVAPSDGAAWVDAQGSSYAAVYAVYTGNSVDGLTRVTSEWGNYTQRFVVKAGTPYYIAIDTRYPSEAQTHKLNLNSMAAPANDAFAEAEVLSGGEAAVSGDNRASSREPGEPIHWSSALTGTNWYAWTAPSTGSITIDTAGSAIDTVVAVYAGDSVSGLNRVAANDNVSYTDRTSRLAFRAIAGTTYRIAVESQPYQGFGEYQLALHLRESPANDLFALATELPGEANVSTTGRADGASAEPGEPSHHAWYPAVSSVWFRWTAPTDGSVSIRATSNAFQPIAAVYTGTQVSGLTRVANQAQPCSCPAGQIRVRVEAGRTYLIAVDSGMVGAGGDFGLTLDLIPRPDNDDFADAAPLAGAAAEVTGTNVGATQEPGEPVHEQNYYDPSVWYSWTAPATGGVTLDTAGSDFRTVLAVYTGDSVGALTRVTSNPVSGSPNNAKRAFRAVAGQTYRIALDGAGALQGNLKLALRTRPVPANDNFASAQPLLGNAATADGDNMGATGEPNEPTPGGTAGASVWYSWTATGTGPATVKLAKADFPGSVTVYTGDSVGSLKSVRYQAPSWSGLLRWRAEEGTTYRIVVHGGAQPARGTFTLELQWLEPPANDDFANAIELAAPSGSSTGSTVDATTEPGEPTHYYSETYHSIWYRWTAPETGSVKVDLTGSTFSPTQAVYVGDSVNALTLVASAASHTLVFRAVAGTTYRVAIDIGGYTGGQVNVAIGPSGGPANDDFAKSTELTGESDTEDGTTVFATREPGEPAHAPGSSSTVWYHWTAPRSGVAGVDLSRAGMYYTGVAVYVGDGLGSLTKIAGDNTQKLRFRVTEGTTYRIVVDSAYGSTSGFTLRLSMPAGQPNDMFADAIELAGESDSEDGSTADGTREPGEPQHVVFGGPTVWYRWTAPRTGPVTIEVASAGSNVYAKAYRGDTLTTLGEMGAGTKFTFRAVEGATYRIAADSSLQLAGPFRLGLRMPAGQPNDDFANAIAMSGVSDREDGSNVDATAEPGEPTPSFRGGASVWYRWTAPRTGSVTLDLSGSEFQTQLGVYTGDSVGSLKTVTQGPAKAMKFRATAGATYRIVVDGQYGAMGALKLALDMPPGPANDDFPNALPLAAGGPPVPGTTVDATAEPGEPMHYSEAHSSVWYSWRAPASGVYAVDTTGSDFSAVIGVYTGTTVSGLSRVGSTKDSRLRFRASEGTTYRIAIDGYGNATGSVRVALVPDPGPPNDDFAAAEELSGRSASATGTNAKATLEPGEPNPWGSDGKSVWWQWTAPASGEASLSLVNSGFDTVASVYTGTRVDQLQAVVSADPPTLTFEAVEGTTYRIAVDGRFGQTGHIQIALDLEPTPPNDDFTNAQELSGDSASASGSTRAATHEPEEPDYYGRGAGSVWFRWRASSDGPTTVDLSGSDFDTTLDVYTGSNLGSLRYVAADDQSGEGDTSKATFEATEGTTYMIAVDGYWGARGSYRLVLSHTEQAAQQPTQQQPAADQQPPGQEPAARDDSRSPGGQNDQATPAPAPPSPAPPSPVAPERRLDLAAAFAPQKLKAVLSKGLTGTVACADTACAIEAAVTLEPATAKKLKLQAAGAPFTATAIQADGPTRLVLKLTPAAKRKLAKVKSLKLTVRIIARSGAQTATAERKLTIKR